MARFSCNDLDGLVLDMQEIAALPDDVIDDMLLSGAEVVRKAHVDSINRHFDKHTAKLIGSPAVHLKVSKQRERYALIYPKGDHHTYRAKGSGSGVARNADLGFVHEFGGHGNKAAGWMREANEKCADEMVEAEEKAYDKWFKSHNL